MKPLLPPAGMQPLLPANAAATEQIARLLDALLVLDVEKSCGVGDLAERVGLKPERLRELLSSFMVAGSEVIGFEAPFNVVFGTADGPLDDDVDLDDEQRAADFVHRAGASLRSEQVALVDDVGRRPVTVDQVAAAVMAGRALLEGGALTERHRDAVKELVEKLADAMHMTLREPVDPDAQVLRKAAQDRQRVEFRYRDAATGADELVTVEPYDVRRRRDSFVLDAGPDPVEGYRTFDIATISNLKKIGDPESFEPPPLPLPEVREQPVDVVVSVPVGSAAWMRLRDGWQGEIVAEHDGRLDVRIAVDRPAASKVAILLLQLGKGCIVVQPASLRASIVAAAGRILEAHPATAD